MVPVMALARATSGVTTTASQRLTRRCTAHRETRATRQSRETLSSEATSTRGIRMISSFIVAAWDAGAAPWSVDRAYRPMM